MSVVRAFGATFREHRGITAGIGEEMRRAAPQPALPGEAAPAACRAHRGRSPPGCSPGAWSMWQAGQALRWRPGADLLARLHHPARHARPCGGAGGPDAARRPAGRGDRPRCWCRTTCRTVADARRAAAGSRAGGVRGRAASPIRAGRRSWTGSTWRSSRAQRVGWSGASGAGKIDGAGAAAAVLRPAGRPHPGRRAGHRAGHPGQPARHGRGGAAGHLAVPPHGAGEHPLRAARRHRGTRCSPPPTAARCRDFIEALPDGFDTHGRRPRREALGRAAAAAGDRAGAAARTRRSCCSTRPPARSTPRASRRSRRRSTT